MKKNNKKAPDLSSKYDCLGSYTGVPSLNNGDIPIQDVDDL